MTTSTGFVHYLPQRGSGGWGGGEAGTDDRQNII